MSKKKIDMLQAAVSDLVRTIPTELPVVSNEKDFAKSVGLVRFRVNPASGLITGFRREGAKAIRSLTAVIRDEHREYQQGTDFNSLVEALESITISIFADRSARLVVPDDLGLLEKNLAQWFADQAIQRWHFIPCAVIPDRAVPFAVGPVSFFHIQDFLKRKNVQMENPEEHHLYGQLFKAMRERFATWIGEVNIDGCDEVRSLQTANLSIDVTLVALQMTVPLYYSRKMARITGRTMPPWTGDIWESATGMHTSSNRCDPGLGFSSSALEADLLRERLLIEAVGRRVEAYIRGNAKLPNLEQRWCDGAYWLHEGLAEPLDSIAVAKLETALEVVLGAQNTKGSSSRLHQAFQSFYGRSSKQPIADDSFTTVEQFVRSIVGARSRILHGTFSTLICDTRVTRREVEFLAWDIIRRFVLMLDAYVASGARADDITTFLKWVDFERIQRTKLKVSTSP
jgi:hypothetical protein